MSANDTITLHQNDPFLLIPPKYRNQSFFGPGEIQEILGIGRKEYTRLQLSGELPPSSPIRSKGQRWSIAALAYFIAGTTNTNTDTHK